MSNVEWRRRKKGTPNQVGQAFPLEPHGDKTKLPKALKQVSFGEIPKSIEERRRKKMTEEELADEELVDQLVAEAKAEEERKKETKNTLEKLDEALKNYERRNRLKKALEEAKSEEEMNDSEEGDGYDKSAENLERIRESRRENEVFG